MTLHRSNQHIFYKSKTDFLRNFLLLSALFFLQSCLVPSELKISIAPKKILEAETAPGSSEFVTIWKTDNAGTSAADQITLPLTNAGIYNFKVNWGDGHEDTITAWNAPATTHTYTVPGTYRVTMTGSFDQFIFAAAGDPEKILEVTKWGSNKWTSMSNAFEGCSNFQITATIAPDLSLVTNLDYTFKNATAFNSNINNWNISSVTSLISTFERATSFNQSLNNWNTSHVTTLVSMFDHATAFNGNISSWVTTNVLDMSFIFHQASVFNSDISGWDTSNVRNMSLVFAEAFAFNQNLDGWKVGNVESTYQMFASAINFDSDLVLWDTSHVLNMDYMFADAKKFNGNIGGWDTSLVTTMTGMFWGAAIFNHDLSSWNVAAVGANHTDFDTDATGWVLPSSRPAGF